MSTPAPSAQLRAYRRLFEGVVPPAMCTTDAQGLPHVNYLSHAEWVDDEHVALSFQFFNHSRANVLATGRASLSIEDPYTGGSVVLQLRYVRTEISGPVFERIRVKLAGIAACTGMEKVFHLRGADVFRVVSVQPVRGVVHLPALQPRCDLAAGLRQAGQRMAQAEDMPALLDALVEGLRRDLCIDHAIVWLHEPRRERLSTLVSLGYAGSGLGSELALADAGLVAVAVREQVPIRIGHLSHMLSYGLSWRSGAAGRAPDDAHATIPLPGLAQPHSQLAVPLCLQGRVLGVLLVESTSDQFFSYDDEDALAALGTQLALSLTVLNAREAEAPAAAVPAPSRVVGPAALEVRHFRRDHTVFVGERYLIKGVAGAILSRLVGDQIATGREHFTTRELRLAGDALGLPDVQDNLGVRLLMLERRLAEAEVGLRIERCGRGQYRLVAQGPLRLTQVD